MSSVAKIFVVLNLVISIVAFGSAATLLGAQDDYKVALAQRIDDYQKLKDKSEGDFTRLTNAVNQEANKASQAISAQKDQQARVADLESQLASQKTLNQSLNATVESLSTEVKKANDANQANKAYLETLSSENKRNVEEMVNSKTQLEKEVANRVGLEQQVVELTNQVNALSAEKGDMDRALREARFLLGKYQEKYGPMTPSRGARGVVNMVKGNLVSISVGSADGVAIGDNYDLSRGDKYVGRIRILSVDKNSAVGQFDMNNPGSGAPPMTGDGAIPGGAD